MHRNYKTGRKLRKRPTRAQMLVAICAICAVFLVGITLYFNQETPTQSIQVSSTQAASAPAIVKPQVIVPSLPARIQIARINVDAKIDYMGLTKAGDMDSPVTIANGGWYKLGSIPGNAGSAVIAGHRTGLKGEPGIFSNLDKLQKGDTITVTDDKAQRISFTVKESRNYDQNEKPPEVFTSTSGSNLNLITCTGSWNATDRRFSKRLVVFAERNQ